MRFLPVKTTDDLFIMRSDRFHLTDQYEMEDGNYIFPNVQLDTRFYKNIHDFDDRFPYGRAIACSGCLGHGGGGLDLRP